MRHRYQQAVWYRILDLLREDGKLTVAIEDEHPQEEYFDVLFGVGRVRVFVKWIDESPSGG